MKKNLLLTLLIVSAFFTNAQVARNYPAGFQKANVPEWMRNFAVKLSESNDIDNQIPFAAMVIPQTNNQSAAFHPVDEYLVGNTFYDIQTNNSISNRLCVNDDGTISMGWTYSPNAISTTNPPFPNRRGGYAYFDGVNFGTPASVGNVRSGFTNIVVTPISELMIAHSNVGTTDSNQIVVSHRSTRGSGSWTDTFPWGHAHDTWPKACAAGSSGTNNNVYVVFQGSGAVGTGSPGAPVAGQSGPIYFSRSLDGGQNWEPKSINPLIDSNYYSGFGADNYCIDAKDSIVVIGFGKTVADVGFLKSTDNGQTWTKTIVQKLPDPLFVNGRTDPNGDGIVDTILSNTGDMKVLIDNNGIVHVWFSAMRIFADSAEQVFILTSTDGLEYWNENMGTDNYVEIASSQDFNGNGVLDVPVDTFTNCSNRMPWGEYNRGMTIMPSAGIDAFGKIYMTYAALDESADTTFFHALHRHIYMMTLAPPYDPADWTYPYDIIPGIADGGSGETQEGAYACTGRHVDNSFAYVLYQRDDAPGHGLAADGTCDKLKNFGNSSDIVLARLSVLDVGIATNNHEDLFVSQNYPNPVKGTTYININLKKRSDVSIEVYDIIGKNIFSEKRKQLSAGNHTIPFNASNLQPGIYNYVVISERQKVSRQMIVQK